MLQRVPLLCELLQPRFRGLQFTLQLLNSLAARFGLSSERIALRDSLSWTSTVSLPAVQHTQHATADLLELFGEFSLVLGQLLYALLELGYFGVGGISTCQRALFLLDSL